MQTVLLCLTCFALGLLLLAFVAIVGLGRIVLREKASASEVRGQIRKLWNDRDELRAEVNRLHGYIGEKLSDAGLAPKTVMLSAVQEARGKGELPADLHVESVSVSTRGPRK